MKRHRIYDVDVHNTWASTAELVEYMPSKWHDYFEGAGSTRALAAPMPTYSRPGGITDRLDAVPGPGRAPGSDYELMREQLLDRHEIDRVLLTFSGKSEPGHPNSALAIDLCRAANEWVADRWLDGRDDRLFGVALVPTGAPAAAAAEIRRVAGRPRVAAIALGANALGHGLGHRSYEPIYDAAAEVGLPLLGHVGVDLSMLGYAYAAGLPTSRAEQFALLDQGPVHHIVDLIAAGVFERHPGLRLLFNECGFTWIPAVMWTLDAHYSILKAEQPDLKRLPSEYFRDHVWVSSQPFDSEAPAGKTVELLRTYGGLEEKICFASDYPHHDSESPSQVAARLPREWRDDILAGNAARLLGWPAVDPADAPALAAGRADG